MENHVHNQEIYLKINLSCCDDCPKRLKKYLLKMKGIYSVVIEDKRKMVKIVGEIDPEILVEKIEKMGKSARIIIPNVDHYHPTKNASHGRNSKTKTPYRCSHESKETSEDEDEDKDEDDTNGHESDYDCQRNKHGKKKHHHCRSFKKKEEEHLCESIDKVPPKIDFFEGNKKKDDDHECESFQKGGINPNVCTDFYCKIHAQRGIIYSKVPSIDDEEHPCHISKGPFIEGNSWFDQSVPVEYFPQTMPPFPPGGHISYPTRIMHGNHEHANHPGRPMPVGYNDEHMAYLGRPMPMAYSGRPRPMPMHAGHNDEHMAHQGWTTPLPTGYNNDEHNAYSRRHMHYPGNNNPGYNNDDHMTYSGRPRPMPMHAGYNDEHMAHPGRTMPLPTGYNNDEHNAYSRKAMHYPGCNNPGYNNDDHMTYSGRAMPYSGGYNNPGYNNDDYMAYSGRALPYPRGYNNDEHMAYSGGDTHLPGYGGYYQ